MHNALKSNEWRWISIYKNFKIQIQNRGPNNSDFLQNWFPPELRSPLFKLQIFQESEKVPPESCRMHWNLMNDEEFGSLKLLQLKDRRGYQIIQLICRIGYRKLKVNLIIALGMAFQDQVYGQDYYFLGRFVQQFYHKICLFFSS